MFSFIQFLRCHTLIISIATTEHCLFHNDKCGSVAILHHESYLTVLYAGFVSALLKMQTGCTPLIKATVHSVNCSHAQGPENPINQLANCNKLCPDIKLWFHTNKYSSTVRAAHKTPSWPFPNPPYIFPITILPLVIHIVYHNWWNRIAAWTEAKNVLKVC